MVTLRERIAWLSLHLVQTILSMAQRTIHVQGHMSNIQIAITPPRIARFRLNLVQSLTMAQPVYYKCSRSKVKVQGHSITRDFSTPPSGGVNTLPLFYVHPPDQLELVTPLGGSSLGQMPSRGSTGHLWIAYRPIHQGRPRYRHACSISNISGLIHRTANPPPSPSPH